MRDHWFTMRSDLKREGALIPAFEDVTADGGVGVHYISAPELVGAEDRSDSKYDDAALWFNYLRLELRDGRVLYFVFADIEVKYVEDLRC